MKIINELSDCKFCGYRILLFNNLSDAEYESINELRTLKIYHSCTLKLPLTRREIWQLISMTTENVIRTLSEFKKDGIIHIDNKTISILEYDNLINFDKAG